MACRRVRIEWEETVIETAEQRSRRMSATAKKRWKNASLEERRASGRRGQAGLIAKIQREIDPDGSLPEEELKVRLPNAISAHFGDMVVQKDRLGRRRRENELKAQSKAKKKVAASSAGTGETAGETAITQSARTGQEPR